MTLNQKLTEFRFNLETLDIMNNMGKSSQSLNELGFNSELISFMQNNRNLLNSVLLRLQLYSEQNMTELKVRSGLSMLNNQSVNHLLDLLYKSSSDNEEPVKQKSSKTELKTKKASTPVPEPEPELVTTEEQQEEEQQEQEQEEQQEEDYFEKFFSECVKYSDDATNVVKMSAMYDAFTKWWSNYSEDEVPSKDDLKEFFSQKLGRQIKSTISNVSL
jgi:hypothetical protein